MLKKEEYLKTVRRPYPPFFTSLICSGYPKKELYEGIVNEPFSIMNMAHVDSVWYYEKAEIERAGKLALEAWKDLVVLKHVKKEFHQREENLVVASVKDYSAFFKAYQAFMPALVLVYAVDKLTELELRVALSRKLDGSKVEQLMDHLNIPLQDNFNKQEEYDLITAKDLGEHVKRYGWLRARYGEELTYTVEEARKKLKELNPKQFLEKWSQRKETLKEKIAYAERVLGSDAVLVDIFQYIIFYRTQRTDIMNKSAFLAIPMLKKTAESLDLTYDQLLLCSAIEVLEQGVPSKDVLNQRKLDCTTLLEDGVVRCLTGDESAKVKEFFEEKVVGAKELKGTIACRGKATGKVKVIFMRNEFGKVNKGDVLVASMTTIEMVSIMKKAVAFVTDEGGVTCHAAILSREMNKPCIIGTGVATKVLKDGDIVEVDANNGIIRILSK